VRSILVTGGADFIGANFVHFLIAEAPVQVIDLDKFTYAGNLRPWPHCGIRLGTASSRAISTTGSWYDACSATTGWDAVINFATESHVDRSIRGLAAFIETNIIGTFNLLDCARGEYWARLGNAG